MRLQGRDLKLEASGADVTLLHRELAMLGFAVPENERRENAFGRATQQIVQRFQSAHLIEPTGVVDAETASKINAAVDALTYTVRGRVASRTRAGVGGLRVEIVDKNVGDDVPLATAVTDEGGAYTTRFAIISLRQRGKQQPDLQARVFTGETFLAASDTRYNASNRQALDIVLPEQADAALASEHESLMAALGTHFSGSLRDLKEGSDRQDITYLANKSGWDARAVALAALADQFSARAATGAAGSGIEPDFFYALFRAGLAASENALYRTDARTAIGIWSRAVKAGVIPAALEARIPRVAEQFERLAAQRALEAPAPAGLSSLKEMLSVSIGDDAGRQRLFADIHVKHGAEPDAFWAAVRNGLGEAAERRLRLDGKLGFLTLNNAPLVRRLHEGAGISRLAHTVDLVAAGLYRGDRWQALIGRDPIPAEIPGDTDAARRSRYAELLAAQVRLSHPTAVLGMMVQSGETPLRQQALAGSVHAFLAEHEGRFDIGMQPIGQYLAQQRLEAAPEVVREISRIQRVYQITPNDAAMNALLRAGLDSAYAVVRYDRDRFVRSFKDAMGGEANAMLAHAKAQQVHNVVLNVAATYYTVSNAPAIGSALAPSIVPPVLGRRPASSEDVIAYPTLESLFGELDYCACDHCRSILSPAAYLVDLLLFCDGPTDEKQKPLSVLLGRRPDIQHLPLTCENTNTPLPYIDLVNETLEHYVVHDQSLETFEGHSTDAEADSQELLATPQFVSDAAYTMLAAQHFPPPLPFHQPLECLRRYLDRFEAPLAEVMEALRKDEGLERASPADYGWRDILMEELRLSRAEHRLFTDGSLTLQQLYGYPIETTEEHLLFAQSDGKPSGMAGAKAFSRRMGISYNDVVEILKTRFVNPGSALLSNLERLGVPFATLKKLKDGEITDAEFVGLLPPGIDASRYGPGGIPAWVKDEANYSQIMGLLLLSHPADAGTLCSFDRVEFRYANPDTAASKVRPFEFVRLLRFIRLWKKLGWTIGQTDKAVGALYPADQAPDSADDSVNRQRLDTGFLVLLPRLGMITRLMTALKLKPAKDLPRLLACFAPIDVHGPASLYRQMFLSPAIVKLDPVFAEDGFGHFLPGTVPLLEHEAALRAGMQLSGDEFRHIRDALGFDASTPLDLANVSAVFRRGWLARSMKLSVRELLLLARCTGIDPFAPPDAPARPTERFIETLDRLRALGLKPAHALYLVWNHDLSGQAAPSATEIAAFARDLRGGFAAIDREFALLDDPTGAIARAQMALACGPEATDLFFGLLDETFVTEVSYSQAQPVLAPAALEAAGGQITYDHFRKHLSCRGVFTEATRDAIKAASGTATELHAAVDELHHRNRGVVGPFFARFPELLPLHAAYVASEDSAESKRAALLASFLPELGRRRKRLLALDAIGATAKVDAAFASALLDDPAVLHSASDAAAPALRDMSAIERPGLSGSFFFSDTATGPVGASSDAGGPLDYSASGPAQLPPNANDPAAATSGIWSGWLEVPAAAFYNISIECDAGATPTLSLDDQPVALVQNGAVWGNAASLELSPAALHRIRLTVERLRTVLRVRWQAAGRGSEVIPAHFLYSEELLDRVTVGYVRFLKLASLAATLKLSANEIKFFGSRAEYRIDGQGWFNSLPVHAAAPPPTAVALHTRFTALLDFARLKADLKAGKDERLLSVLKDPAAATQDADGILYALTRWHAAALDALLARFGKTTADLAGVETLARVHAAHRWVHQLAIAAPALIDAATNEPDAETVRKLQSALRARYDEAAWLQVLKQINDDVRSLQRDALVAHILDGMRGDPEHTHIDTPDKLFEYFLMDVQMDPCMQTSRVRHALSSVQLFIERCLMNLEQDVAPSSINAKHWAWMKRYRVWEANRKVFLWPENWLEPELRDDQSPFFKEAMSELLQSDINDDRAAGALLNYLGKLEEVSKLEPCGLHYVEGDLGKLQDDVAYVIARTPGANRKYYHRRRDSSGWAPWEQIKLDIEDNPVLPVVWSGRLFLLWLRIIKQAAAQPSKPGEAGQQVSTLTTDDIDANTRVTAQAILCWSEYLNGKWQATRTSDVTRPLGLGEYDALGGSAFDRSRLRLSAMFWTKRALRVIVSTQFGYGASFFLHNTQGTPELRGLKKEKHFEAKRELDTETSSLKVRYSGTTHALLKNGIAHRTIEPHHPLAGNPWSAPFFYEDGRHVFYVTTSKRLLRVPNWNGFHIDAEPTITDIEIAGLVFEPLRTVDDPEGPIVRQLGFGRADHHLAMRLVSEDAHIRHAIGSPGTVTFGEHEIGPMGSVIRSPRAR